MSKIKSLILGLVLLCSTSTSVFCQSSITPTVVASPGPINIGGSLSTNISFTISNVVDVLGLPPSIAKGGSLIVSGLTDMAPYITNSVLQLNTGIIYNKSLTKGKLGYFLDTSFPMNSQASIGVCGGYLNDKFLYGSVNGKFGVSTRAPLCGKIFGYAVSGPEYDIKKRAIGAYSFVGVIKSYDITKRWTFLWGVAIGSISTIPGITEMVNVGVDYHW